MTLPLATHSDVAVKMQRSLTTAESAAADVYLVEASAILRRKVSGLDTLITAGTVDGDLAKGVVTDAVARVLRNPSGVVSQAIGAESASWGRTGAVGKVVITDDEIASILPIDPSTVTVGGVAVGTVELKAPWWVTTETWREQIPPWVLAGQVPPIGGGEQVPPWAAADGYPITWPAGDEI